MEEKKKIRFLDHVLQKEELMFIQKELLQVQSGRHRSEVLLSLV